jgi:hypothetical protein
MWGIQKTTLRTPHEIVYWFNKLFILILFDEGILTEKSIPWNEMEDHETPGCKDLNGAGSGLFNNTIPPFV